MFSVFLGFRFLVGILKSISSYVGIRRLMHMGQIAYRGCTAIPTQHARM